MSLEKSNTTDFALDRSTPITKPASVDCDAEAKYGISDPAQRTHNRPAVLPTTNAGEDVPAVQPSLDRQPSVLRVDSSSINLPNGNTTQVTDVTTTNPTSHNSLDLAQQATAVVSSLATLHSLYNQYQAATQPSASTTSAQSDQPVPTVNNQPQQQQQQQPGGDIISQAKTAYDAIKALMNTGVSHINTTTTMNNAQDQHEVAKDDVEKVERDDVQHAFVEDIHASTEGTQQSQSVNLQSALNMLSGLIHPPAPAAAPATTTTTTTTNNNNTAASTTQNQNIANQGNQGGGFDLGHIATLASTVGPMVASWANRNNTASVPDASAQTNPSSASNPNTNLFSTVGTLASTFLNNQQQPNPITSTTTNANHNNQQNNAAAPPGLADTLDNISRGMRGLSQLSTMFGK